MQSGSTPSTEDKFKNITSPGADDLSYQIQQLVEQGVITPEQAQAATAGRSELDNVTSDPKLKAAQMDALSQLQDIGSSGGMTLADKSNLNQISVDEATKAKGQRDAIIQNAQARGLGGSGLDLMAQLQNEQSTASDKSSRDLAVAGQAQARALDALTRGGTLAGNIESQQFNEGATKANANDAISKFNAQNKQATNLQNATADNQAQALNLQNKQNVANQNAALQTQQNKQRGDVAQQVFNNNTALASGQQNTANLNTQREGQNSTNNANSTNQTVGTALTAAAMFSDERGKKDIEQFDPSDFLDSITGYKFKYKEPKKFGAGDKFGPMAQDLEKTHVGASMVKDTPEGKMVDTGKAAMAALASLADVHKRLKKVEGKGDV